MKMRFEAKVTGGFSLSLSLSRLVAASPLALDLFREEKSRKTSGTGVGKHWPLSRGYFGSWGHILVAVAVVERFKQE